MKNKGIILGSIDAILAKIKGKGVILSYDLTTSTGVILKFADVTGDNMPKAGDMATIEDKPAQGEVMVVNEDGTSQVYVFDTENKGELLEIKEPEKPAEEETVENLKEQVKDLTEKMATMQAKADGFDSLGTELQSLKRLIVSSGEESDKGARKDKGTEDEETEEQKMEKDTATVMAKLEELKKKKSGAIS